MQPFPTPAASARRPPRAGPGSSGASAPAPRTRLAIAGIGYLLPRRLAGGRVHSVFAQACNFGCGDGLLTLGAAHAGNGPTTLRLADANAGDLRAHFAVGEAVVGDGGGLRTRRSEVCCVKAEVWRPATASARLAPDLIEARRHGAARLLHGRHDDRRSVIDREAAPVTAALRAACGALDAALAEQQAEHLIGWGEGLTPAGDDFLVGLLAALAALVDADAARLAFRDALATAVRRATPRTTAISAHCLELACLGHCSEPLLDARAALLSEARQDLADAALARALAVGASSGADTLAGLLAGVSGWLPAARDAAP